MKKRWAVCVGLSIALLLTGCKQSEEAKMKKVESLLEEGKADEVIKLVKGWQKDSGEWELDPYTVLSEYAEEKYMACVEGEGDEEQLETILATMMEIDERMRGGNVYSTAFSSANNLSSDYDLVKKSRKTYANAEALMAEAKYEEAIEAYGEVSPKDRKNYEVSWTKKDEASELLREQRHEWSDVKVGDTKLLGTYEIDNYDNGVEEIPWKVLEVKDGKALLIVEYILDMNEYSEGGGEAVWESSSLREWLNGEFMDTAFSDDEKEIIAETTVMNDDNDTIDKLFILSQEEFEQYFQSEEERDISSSSRVFWSREDYESYWMRTPGDSEKREVIYNSYQKTFEIYPTGGRAAVLPVMWVDLTAAAEMKESSFDYANKITIGKHVTFGHYEQDNDEKNGQEPIGWTVIDIEDGKALLLSRKGLDCVQYNTVEERVHWKDCSLRTWLNNDFFDTAFTDEEKAGIVETELSGGYYSSSIDGQESEEATLNKVFLISESSCNWYRNVLENDMYCVATPYAASKGAEIFRGGYSLWLLRSYGGLYGDGPLVAAVSRRYSNVSVTSKEAAVRPAIWVSLDYLK